jgi:hypothetical protein
MSDKLHSLELALDSLPAEHRDEVKRILYGNPCEYVQLCVNAGRRRSVIHRCLRARVLPVAEPAAAAAAAKEFELKAYKIACAPEQVGGLHGCGCRSLPHPAGRRVGPGLCGWV